MRAALLILLALTLHTFAAPSHWAYTAPERPALPKTDSDWPRNPIDYFILAKQKDNQLAPSPTASPGQLLRRVHLDLTGLPPTPDVVAQFLENPSERIRKIVDDLLYSNHYGERWARPWLDLARYADSNGFQADQLRDSWAYRDWVINAFNSGMPFNQFVIEQIAGDLLPNATPSQRIATGFHRTPTCNVEAGVHPEENRVNQVFDRVNTTGTVFLGTTLECAQCHDHKYDPFSIKDYYSLFAFFNNTPLEVKQNGNSVTFEFYGPTMDLPISTEQQKALDTLNSQKKRLDQQLAKLKTDSAAQQAKWEKATLTALQNAPEWSVLGIKQFSASGNPSTNCNPTAAWSSPVPILTKAPTPYARHGPPADHGHTPGSTYSPLHATKVARAATSPPRKTQISSSTNSNSRLTAKNCIRQRHCVLQPNALARQRQHRWQPRHRLGHQSRIRKTRHCHLQTDEAVSPQARCIPEFSIAKPTAVAAQLAARASRP